jgi:UbiD family decarboxylase
MYNNLRDFISALEEKKNLIRIKKEVSTILEMTEIHRRVLSSKGPAIIFTLYPQKLALTSPTSGGRSVGIVRSRTQATE